MFNKCLTAFKIKSQKVRLLSDFRIVYNFCMAASLNTRSEELSVVYRKTGKKIYGESKSSPSLDFVLCFLSPVSDRRKLR